MKAFQTLNKGYNRVFKPGQLSVGIVVPIENYSHSVTPDMRSHLERIKLVETLRFKAIWIRDIPFLVPSFGDAGQVFAPFSYLGFLAGQTAKITLGISSLALPLHHPAHVAKAAATIDQLSGGRFIMGIASGDRSSEYPAMSSSFEKRGERFREAFDYIRKAQESFPVLNGNLFGELDGTMDIIPKPTAGKLPMLMTGFSQQSMEWNAKNTDGWMYYPAHPDQQQKTIRQWRAMVFESREFDQPFMQPLYVVLEPNDDYKPQPIQLGFRIGANY